MKITEKLKVALKSLLSIKLTEINTDKGTLIYDADELEVGMEVFVKDENGEIISAPDGIYLFDIYTITVKDGKVENIEENEEKVAEEVTEEVTEEVAMAEEPAEEPIVEEEVVEDTVISTDKLEEILTSITELYNKVIGIESKVASLEEKMLKIETEPATEPITQPIEPEQKMSKLSYLKK